MDRDRLRTIFQHLDVKGEGKLSRDDFTKLLVILTPFPKDVVANLIQNLEWGPDNKLTYDYVIDWLLRPRRPGGNFASIRTIPEFYAQHIELPSKDALLVEEVLGTLGYPSGSESDMGELVVDVKTLGSQSFLDSLPRELPVRAKAAMVRFVRHLESSVAKSEENKVRTKILSLADDTAYQVNACDWAGLNSCSSHEPAPQRDGTSVPGSAFHTYQRKHLEPVEAVGNTLREVEADSTSTPKLPLRELPAAFERSLQAQKALHAHDQSSSRDFNANFDDEDPNSPKAVGVRGAGRRRNSKPDAASSSKHEHVGKAIIELDCRNDENTKQQFATAHPTSMDVKADRTESEPASPAFPDDSSTPSPKTLAARKRPSTITTYPRRLSVVGTKDPVVKLDAQIDVGSEPAAIGTGGKGTTDNPTILHEKPADQEILGISRADMKPFGNLTGELQGAINAISTDLFGLPFSVSVAIPFIEDTPLIGISEGFCTLTGYSREEVIGRNCRFLLQGVPANEVSSKTRLEARRYCRAAHLRNLTMMAHTFLLQRNSRKNGELFWNLFMLMMVPGPDKRTYVMALQLDLGPEIEAGAAEAAIEAHRGNLELVQKLMFGQKVSRFQLDPLSTTEKDMQAVKVAEYLGLASEVGLWLQKAEAASASFQEWGTLPWVAWPTSTKYALVNGGVTLLRLEADVEATGALGMSIFPVKRLPRGRSFKVQIDQVSSPWGCHLQSGGMLPSFGFTETSPAVMDELGGLPELIEHTANTICLRADGRVTINRNSSHVPPGSDALHVLGNQAKPQFPYEITAGDNLTFTWGPGFAQLDVNGDIVYKLEDKGIEAPPKKPLYAVVDCCHAVCKMTLVA